MDQPYLNVPYSFVMRFDMPFVLSEFVFWFVRIFHLAMIRRLDSILAC